jgi:hypothetical protein
MAQYLAINKTATRKSIEGQDSTPCCGAPSAHQLSKLPLNLIWLSRPGRIIGGAERFNDHVLFYIDLVHAECLITFAFESTRLPRRQTYRAPSFSTS